MERILVLIHTEADGSVGQAALEALGVAEEIRSKLGAGALQLGIIGKGAAEAARTIGGCAPAHVFVVDGAEFHNPRYGTDALAAEKIIRRAEPTLVIAPGTSRFNRVVPGAACRVQGRADTHVTAVDVQENTIVATRWLYRQRIEVRFTRPVRPWILLIEPGACTAAQSVPGTPPIEHLTVETPESALRTEALGTRAPESALATIRPDAELLFVAGAGWTKKQADGQVHLKEAEELILEFLRLSGASLGSTKSLVDLSAEGQATLSFLTHMNQVGQTGATPRHPKGLATCCHGEEPHTVGWRFIHERRAINRDPNCGWARGKADVLYVADAFAVLRKLNEKLARAKGQS